MEDGRASLPYADLLAFRLVYVPYASLLSCHIIRCMRDIWLIVFSIDMSKALFSARDRRRDVS